MSLILVAHNYGSLTTKLLRRLSRPSNPVSYFIAHCCIPPMIPEGPLCQGPIRRDSISTGGSSHAIYCSSYRGFYQSKLIDHPVILFLEIEHDYEPFFPWAVVHPSPFQPNTLPLRVHVLFHTPPADHVPDGSILLHEPDPHHSI